jgi:hypothetical protein
MGGDTSTPMPPATLSRLQSVYQGDADLGFSFSCEMDTTKKRPRAVITGEIDYHDEPSSIVFGG